MAISRARKGAELAKGAAVGGGTVAAIGATVATGMKALKMAAPRVAAVAIPGVAAVAAGVTVYEAGKAAVRSARRGESAGEIAKHAALGAVGLDDAVTAAKKRADSRNDPIMMLGGPKETDEQRKERLGKNLGGSPNDLKLAIEREKEALGKADTGKMQRYHDRRLRALETQLKIDEGRVKVVPANSEPLPAPTKPEGFGARMLRKAENALEGALFGDKKPKEDSLDKQRGSVEREVGAIRKEMEDEAKSGRGSKYTKLQMRLDEKEGELTKLTGEKAKREDAEAAAYRQVGAMATGAVVGAALGRMTANAAKKAAQTAEEGVEKLAEKAAKLISKSPNGVIAGTIEGDKAGAAVKAAKAAVAKPAVTSVEAYGLPALNVGHGVAAYGYAATHPDDPAASTLRMEGAGAIAAGVVGAKFGVAARALRPTVSPDAAGKLSAVEKRLGREARGGTAGAAQANARATTSAARGQAQMADISRKADVAKAQVRGTRDVAKTQIGAVASIETAKVRGAGKVMVEGHKQAGEIRKAAKAAEPKSRVTYKTGKQHTQAEIASYQKRSVRMKSAYGSNKIASVPVNDNATTMASHGYKGASK